MGTPLRAMGGLRAEAAPGAVRGSPRPPAASSLTPASGSVCLEARAGLTSDPILAPGGEGMVPSSPWQCGEPPPRPLPHYGLPPHFLPQGAVATGEDPTSVAIASIQSAATFPDPNIKYVFRTENGGTQVRRPPDWVRSGQGTPRGRRREGFGLAAGFGPLARSQPEGERGGKHRGLILHWTGLDAGVGHGRAELPPRTRPRSRGSLSR